MCFSFFCVQFFSDVKDAQDKMKKMQENMKKKYSCDRSTTATRLEDLLQDAVVSQSPSGGRTSTCKFDGLNDLLFLFFSTIYINQQEEREQLNEFKTVVTGLNKRAKSIIQLKPRNPTTPIKGKLPIQAVCDFKQQEVRHIINHRKTSNSLFDTFFSLFCRSLFIKVMSVHSSTTPSLSNGGSLITPAARQQCRLSASWCLQSTRRPWTASAGKNDLNSLFTRIVFSDLDIHEKKRLKKSKRH